MTGSRTFGNSPDDFEVIDFMSVATVRCMSAASGDVRIPRRFRELHFSGGRFRVPPADTVV